MSSRSPYSAPYEPIPAAKPPVYLENIPMTATRDVRLGIDAEAMPCRPQERPTEKAFRQLCCGSCWGVCAWNAAIFVILTGAVIAAIVLVANSKHSAAVATTSSSSIFLLQPASVTTTSSTSTLASLGTLQGHAMTTATSLTSNTEILNPHTDPFGLGTTKQKATITHTSGVLPSWLLPDLPSTTIDSALELFIPSTTTGNGKEIVWKTPKPTPTTAVESQNLSRTSISAGFGFLCALEPYFCAFLPTKTSTSLLRGPPLNTPSRSPLNTTQSAFAALGTASLPTVFSPITSSQSAELIQRHVFTPKPDLVPDMLRRHALSEQEGHMNYLTKRTMNAGIIAAIALGSSIVIGAVLGVAYRWFRHGYL